MLDLAAESAVLNKHLEEEIQAAWDTHAAMSQSDHHDYEDQGDMSMYTKATASTVQLAP